MGCFDFLTNRKNFSSPSEIEINLKNDSIVINGVSVDIPTGISFFEDILGRPRRVDYPKQDDESYDLRQVNYTWDKLGLCCYTKGGTVVYCFEIRLNKGDISPEHYPAEFFSGKLLINGKEWLKAVKNAPTTPIALGEPEFFRKLKLGRYSALAEYVDFMQDEKTRTEKDFTTISVQLEYD